MARFEQDHVDTGMQSDPAFVPSPQMPLRARSLPRAPALAAAFALFCILCVVGTSSASSFSTASSSVEIILGPPSPPGAGAVVAAMVFVGRGDVAPDAYTALATSIQKVVCAVSLGA